MLLLMINRKLTLHGLIYNIAADFTVVSISSESALVNQLQDNYKSKWPYV